MISTITGRRVRRLLAALLLFAVGSANATPVDAVGYTDYWLWGGLPSPLGILGRARSIYFLQGEIRQARHDPNRIDLIAQGVSLPQRLPCDVWLVYRANTLLWPRGVTDPILARLDRWRRAGNRVVGLQIDFDASTQGLSSYVAALRDLRAVLPPSYRLSVTGLLDWARNGDTGAIGALAGIVDEVVLQTYQGRSTIRNYADYLVRLDRLHVPYKIGLVQSGEWKEVSEIEKSPWFRGYVVFLLPPKRQSSDSSPMR